MSRFLRRGDGKAALISPYVGERESDKIWRAEGWKAEKIIRGCVFRRSAQIRGVGFINRALKVCQGFFGELACLREILKRFMYRGCTASFHCCVGKTELKRSRVVY